MTALAAKITFVKQLPRFHIYPGMTKSTCRGDVLRVPELVMDGITAEYLGTDGRKQIRAEPKMTVRSHPAL